ncbi:MAG: hypothetical protein ABFR82_00225 [Nitrospirota bacterium]
MRYFVNVGAVYVFTKRTEKDGMGMQKFLFIGQTMRLEEDLLNANKTPCNQ